MSTEITVGNGPVSFCRDYIIRETDISILDLAGTVLLDIINEDRDQNNKTLDDILPEGVNIQQVESVIEYTDDESADDGTTDFTNTATHAGSAKNDSRDRVHLGTFTSCWLTGEHT